MESFVYSGLHARVIFGSGTRSKVGEELSRLNCSRALVLSTPVQCDGAQEIAQALGDKAVGVFAQATMHTPVEITELAVAKVRSLGADCTIALGGGSTTGLGKKRRETTDHPHVQGIFGSAACEMAAPRGQLDERSQDRPLGSHRARHRPVGARAFLPSVRARQARRRQPEGADGAHRDDAHE
jgi:alcohol dehydrogenase class IV